MKRFFGLLLILTLTSCTSLFYQPDSVLYSEPTQYKLNYKTLTFNSKDGTPLSAWLIEATTKKKKGLVLQFHGNAQNMSSHWVSVGWLAQHGYDVLAFDYREYGISEGDADPKGVYEDSLAAFDFGYEKFKETKGETFIVIGQSLGGAIAMRALRDFSKRDEVDLLMLDSTFDSYQDIAFRKLKKFWFTFIFSPLAYVLVSDKYSPYDDVPTFKMPVLVVYGDQDFVVESYFGKRIAERLTTEKKFVWEIPEGKHTDVFFRENRRYQQEFLDLLKSLGH
ncbi:MAG: alpha/beta hydrolase [Bdellovibrio sp.]